MTIPSHHDSITILAMRSPKFERDFKQTQIDLLGDRLRREKPTPEDLILLDKYRESFDSAYLFVLNALREACRKFEFRIEPTGRASKSTQSIIDKLRRESILLNKIQDIAGCRLVLANQSAQNVFVTRVAENLFPGARVIDRRKNPSHGYRAVHVIVEANGKKVEIQLRTQLEHVWAIHSERFADIIDKRIKYGGGNPLIQGYLLTLSEIFSLIEDNIASSGAFLVPAMVIGNFFEAGSIMNGLTAVYPTDAGLLDFMVEIQKHNVELLGKLRKGKE